MSLVTRDGWLEAATRQLAAAGIDSVRVEPLARQLGVTKGSFYHHFDNRQMLLDALVDQWQTVSTEAVIALIEIATPDEPQASLRQLVSLTIGNPSEFDGAETAIRNWAAHDADVAARCADVDERRMAWVAELFERCGVNPAQARHRSELLYRVVLGEYLWRHHNGQPLNPDVALELVDHLAVP